MAVAATTSVEVVVQATVGKMKELAMAGMIILAHRPWQVTFTST